ADGGDHDWRSPCPAGVRREALGGFCRIGRLCRNSGDQKWDSSTWLSLLLLLLSHSKPVSQRCRLYRARLTTLTTQNAKGRHPGTLPLLSNSWPICVPTWPGWSASSPAAASPVVDDGLSLCEAHIRNHAQLAALGWDPLEYLRGQAKLTLRLARGEPGG